MPKDNKRKRATAEDVPGTGAAKKAAKGLENRRKFIETRSADLMEQINRLNRRKKQ